MPEKEIYRIFYMVKGHINVAPHVAQACYDGYFERLWYNPEASDEGFDKLWVTYKNGLNAGL